MKSELRWPSHVEPSLSVYRKPSTSPGIIVCKDSTLSIRTICEAAEIGGWSTFGTGRVESRQFPAMRGAAGSIGGRNGAGVT